MIERADFGVAERKGDFRQPKSLVFQEVQRQRLAHVVLQVGVVHAGILQPPLERPHRGAGRPGEVLDAALALDQHSGDLAAQLLDLATPFRQGGEPKIAVMAHQALDHGIGRHHRPLEQAGVEADAGPGMADPDVVAHDLRAGAAFHRRFVRQLRQQDFLRGPTRIAEPDAHEVAREGDRPVGFLPVRHHQRIDIVGIHEHDPVAGFHAVHGGVDHGRQIAPHHFEGFADRARGEGDIADDAGVPRLVLGAELQAELRIGQEIGAVLQELQIADERHAPVGIAQVAGLETGAAQGVTRVGPARAHVGVEAVDEAGQIDGRRRELGRGASFRRHWRDLARLWRSISRPSCLCRLLKRPRTRPLPAVPGGALGDDEGTVRC